MKRYFRLYIGLVILFSFVGLASCENDWDNMVVQPTTAPDNIAVDKTTPFVCTLENETEVAFTFSWSKADFGENVPVTYVLQFDEVGNNFASPADLVAGNNITRRDVVSSELNTIMHALGQPIDVSVALEVRILARPMVHGSATPNLDKLMSVSKTGVSISSYAMPPVHLMGTPFAAYGVDPNAWSATNYSWVMFRDNPLGLDKYVAWFNGFDPLTYAGQIVVLKDADIGQWKQIGKGGDGQLKPASDGGDNINIPGTGYYTFTVDMAKMTYTIEPYDASGSIDYVSMELAVAGGSSVTMTQSYNNPHIWEADNVNFNASESVRFKAGSASWGSATFPWGTGTTDGDDITISRDGRYFVKFNDLTGHYIFYKR